MTDSQIKEQVKVIREVTETLSASKEKAAAFLRAAGIAAVPPTRADVASRDKKPIPNSLNNCLPCPDLLR
jgi:hypothetical protein